MMNFIKNKKKWIISFAILIFLLIVCFKFLNFNFGITKDPTDKLEVVEKVMGSDLVESVSYIDEVLKYYNKRDFKGLFNTDLFSDEFKKLYTTEQFQELSEKMHDFTGDFISYDLDKARIETYKNTKGNKRYSFYMPAKFTKYSDSTIIFVLIGSSKNDKLKIQAYKFDSNIAK